MSLLIHPANRILSDRRRIWYYKMFPIMVVFGVDVGWVDVVDVRELVLFLDARRC